MPRDSPWKPSALAAAVVAGLTVAAIVAGLTYLFTSRPHERSIVGGCAAFNLYAQNQFTPVGAKLRDEPRPTSRAHPAFAPNEIVTVDGWVRTRTPYPTNVPPWDSDVWYHLANDSGWVSFAAVRSVPTTPDPDGGFGKGSDPAPTDADCEGSLRT